MLKKNVTDERQSSKPKDPQPFGSKQRRRQSEFFNGLPEFGWPAKTREPAARLSLLLRRSVVASHRAASRDLALAGVA